MDHGCDPSPWWTVRETPVAGHPNGPIFCCFIRFSESAIQELAITRPDSCQIIVGIRSDFGGNLVVLTLLTLFRRKSFRH